MQQSYSTYPPPPPPQQQQPGVDLFDELFGQPAPPPPNMPPPPPVEWGPPPSYFPGQPSAPPTGGQMQQPPYSQAPTAGQTQPPSYQSQAVPAPSYPPQQPQPPPQYFGGYSMPSRPDPVQAPPPAPVPTQQPYYAPVAPVSQPVNPAYLQSYPPQPQQTPPVPSRPVPVQAPSPAPVPTQQQYYASVAPPVNAAYPPSYPPQPQQTPPVPPVDPALKSTVDTEYGALKEIARLRKELGMEQAREAELQAAKDKWECRTCTFQNKITSLTCDMCQTPNPSAPPKARTQSVAGTMATTGQSPAPTATWTCAQCCCKTNPTSTATCTVCGSARTSGAPASSAAPPGPALRNVYSCAQCTLENSVEVAKCSACDYPNPNRRIVAPPPLPVPPPPQHAYPVAPSSGGGGWACPTCTFVNTATSGACGMCTTARPGGAPPSSFDTPQPQVLAQGHGSTAPRPQEAEDDDDDVLWQDDKVVSDCTKCHTAFTLFNRRHHCRLCGFVFCSTCSPMKVTLKGKQVRSCLDCYSGRVQTVHTPSQPAGGPPLQPTTGYPAARQQPTAPPQPPQQPSYQNVYQQAYQQVAQQPRQPVPCDCAMGAQGFHRPGCINRR